MPPIQNSYFLPGRRGLVLTCGDVIQFDPCTDCAAKNLGQNTPCPEWSQTVIEGTEPAGTYMSPDGLLTIGPDCTLMSQHVIKEISVVDSCNPGAVAEPVTIMIGQVLMEISDVWTSPNNACAEGEPCSDGDNHVEIEVVMCNKYHPVKGIQVDIEDMPSLPYCATQTADMLSCNNCTPDEDRAPEYTCTAYDDGEMCRIVMTSNNPASLIGKGCGPIFTVEYAIDPRAPADDCLELELVNVLVADRFNDPLCVCPSGGKVCFTMCGDIYPRDCLPDMPNCGDGIVDIFDILEEIDFALGIVKPSDCQHNAAAAPPVHSRADVPTGTPPYCTAPDGDINIFDVLVIIDMALGKANCCEYYYGGKIY